MDLALVLDWAHSQPDIAREGLGWYDRALAECRDRAAEIGQPVERVVAVVAILSPQLRWERNVRYAVQLLTALETGQPLPSIPTYGSNVRKAIRAAQLEDPSVLFDPRTGPKTWSFYRNILGDPEPVTIDRHIVSLWTQVTGRPVRPTVSEYRVMARTIQELAYERSVQPRQAQAMLWIAWRDYRAKVSEIMTGGVICRSV